MVLEAIGSDGKEKQTGCAVPGVWGVSWALWAAQAGVGTPRTKLDGNWSLLTKS